MRRLLHFSAVWPGLFLLVAVPAHATGTELQWALCEPTPERVLHLLDKEDWRASSSSITYFESARPRYLAEGLSFRVKEECGVRTAVVKVRSANGVPIGDACEWDRYGNEEVYACSRKAKLEAGAAPWPPELRAFAEARLPVDWAALRAFGPYRVDKWAGRWKKRKFSLEALRADRSYLELSLRAERAEAEEAYREFTERLERKGVQLCARQEGKTERLFRGSTVRAPAN